VNEIEVGSLVIFLEDFMSESIPNVGIVLSIISFDELVGEELGKGITWYSVMFGEVDIVVSSEMVILLN
tara:strand:- start:276 stop:482 length:207 start_codon:yes stop_codon:yes gene_type:complete